jgi:hypothetical protein
VAGLEAAGMEIAVAFVEKRSPIPIKLFHNFLHKYCDLLEAQDAHAVKLIEFRRTIVLFTLEIKTEATCCNLRRKNMKMSVILTRERTFWMNVPCDPDKFQGGFMAALYDF